MLELNKNNDFVKSVFAYINGENINDAVKLFRQLEKKHKILFTFINDLSCGEFCDDVWIENNLYSFLFDSQLIIAGEVINEIEIYNSDFKQLEITWRHWGEILAKCLNKQEIEKPLIGRNKSTKWKYIDFYMDTYASQWIKDYNDWAKAISEVIIEKDRVFASEYRSIND